jgi:putative hydrolase of the HAD superfamily
MDGLLIDWGGVLTTSMFASFAAFSAREGVDPRAAFRDDTPARQALVDLESGDIDLPTFEQRVGAVLGVDPHDLARRLTQDLHPDQAMRDAVRRFHDAGITTVLVSNSWRTTDYDGLDMFDAVVLSQTEGVRKPDPRIYKIALERVALAPPRCVFVDDLGGNLKAAKALGMTTYKHERTEITIPALDRLLLPGAS